MSRSVPFTPATPLNQGQNRGSIRAAIMVSSLAGGGAERAALLTAEGLAGLGHQVTLITIAGMERDAYRVSPAFARVALALEGDSLSVIEKLWRNFVRVRSMRAALQAARAEVVIGFGDQANVLTILTARSLGIPVLVSEQVDPRHHDCGRVWRALRRLLYPLAAGLICASAGVDEAFAWVPKRMRAVIANPLPVQDCRGSLPFPARSTGEARVRLLAMGRLTAQKGFDLLLEAFAEVRPDFPNWELWIFGEGPDREALENLRSHLGLDGVVHLPGFTRDPVAEFQRAELFVLSSRYEGFGNVLIEAMACGLPVVSVDCPSGPRDIVRHNIDGLLVAPQSPPVLADGLRQLMGDGARRKQFGHRAREVTHRFGLPVIAKQWETLIFDRILQVGVRA